jgi:hypothetical protein
VRLSFAVIAALTLLGCDARDDVIASFGGGELDVNELDSSIRDEDGIRTVVVVAKDNDCSFDNLEYIIARIRLRDPASVPLDTTINLTTAGGAVEAELEVMQSNCGLGRGLATGTILFTSLSHLTAEGDLRLERSNFDGDTCHSSQPALLEWEDFEVPLSLGSCD